MIHKDEQQDKAREKFLEKPTLEFPLELPGITMNSYEHDCSECGNRIKSCRGSVADFGEMKILDVVTHCPQCGNYYDAPKMKFDEDNVYLLDEGQWQPLTMSRVSSMLDTLKEKLSSVKEKLLGK